VGEEVVEQTENRFYSFLAEDNNADEVDREEEDLKEKNKEKGKINQE
jgi:hypothetical protein